MINKLPHETTTGVTATEEGLVVDKVNPLYDWVKLNGAVKVWPLDNREPYRIWKWPDAAERLRYPGHGLGVYCNVLLDVTVNFDKTECGGDCMLLTRISAMLHDDAEAFRVLHWCVTNLGGVG